MTDDVKIICGERTFLSDQKTLSLLPYFAATFRSEMQENLTNEINLSHLDGDCIKIILESLQTGKVSTHRKNNIEMMQSLYTTSHYLQAERVESFALNTLRSLVDKKTAPKILEFATDYNIESLKWFVQNYIEQNKCK
uniref:BTB domain-containing protein n=1 Tax=Strigamia maritima TaxID=126957 RepID=T1IZM0_STRMM